MSSWGDVAGAAPDLAARVRHRFAVRKHATMATLRRDGSPRISGTEAEFDDREVWLGSMRGAVKALDLRHDPRLSLHSPTVDPQEGGEWEGEAKLAGRAVEVPHPDGADGAHRFRIDIEEVVLTHVEAGRLVIESWHPSRGVEVRERR